MPFWTHPQRHEFPDDQAEHDFFGAPERDRPDEPSVELRIHFPSQPLLTEPPLHQGTPSPVDDPRSAAGARPLISVERAPSLESFADVCDGDDVRQQTGPGAVGPSRSNLWGLLDPSELSEQPQHVRPAVYPGGDDPTLQAAIQPQRWHLNAAEVIQDRGESDVTMRHPQRDASTRELFGAQALRLDRASHDTSSTPGSVVVSTSSTLPVARRPPGKHGSGRHKRTPVERPGSASRRGSVTTQRRSRPTGHLSRAKVFTAVAAALAVSLVALVATGRVDGVFPRGAGGSTGGGGAWSLSTEAQAWLEQNTASDIRIAVPDKMQPQLARRLRGRTLQSYEAATSSKADLLVLGPTKNRAATSDALDELVASSAVHAVFADGSQVRVILNGTSPAKAHIARQQAGRELVRDKRIRLAPHAYTSLLAGDVDPRLMGLLSRVARLHTVDVAGFPRSAPERAARAPAREMRITAMDGQLVSERGAVESQLAATMLGEPEPFQPAEVRLPGELSPGALLVRFVLPSPIVTVDPQQPAEELP